MIYIQTEEKHINPGLGLQSRRPTAPGLPTQPSVINPSLTVPNQMRDSTSGDLSRGTFGGMKVIRHLGGLLEHAL
jgi:hypothetical protein